MWFRGALRSGVVMWTLAVPSLASADAPVEEFYLPFERIPTAVLRDARGVLSVMCRDPVAARRYRDLALDPLRIPAYAQLGGAFRRSGSLDLEQTRPLSGWLFDVARVRRFPVVERSTDYLKIVYDARKDSRAWVHRADVSRLMPAGWGTSSTLTWFADATPAEGLSIDVFFLLGSPKRRWLYARPRADAKQRRISGEESGSRWLAEEAGASQPDPRELVITRVLGGFAQLGLANTCTGEIKPLRKWIRIRDQQGRLTVWPVAGLLC